MTNTMVIDGLDEIEVENTSVEEIDSENVNLIFVGVDQSGSMYNHVADMKACLADFRDAITNSKEADEILLARANFASTVEVSGYKNVGGFDVGYVSSGCTLMNDLIIDGEGKLLAYIAFLKAKGMRVKAVFALFSDGLDEGSQNPAHVAKASVGRLNDAEVTTAFISFGGTAAGTAADYGFRNILTVGSSASELRKAFNCLSKSVIESSKSVVADGDDFFQM